MPRGLPAPWPARSPAGQHWRHGAGPWGRDLGSAQAAALAGGRPPVKQSCPRIDIVSNFRHQSIDLGLISTMDQLILQRTPSRTEK